MLDVGLFVLLVVVAIKHAYMGMQHALRRFYAFAYFDLGIACIGFSLAWLIKDPLFRWGAWLAVAYALWFLGGIALGFWRISQGPDPRLVSKAHSE